MGRFRMGLAAIAALAFLTNLSRDADAQAPRERPVETVEHEAPSVGRKLKFNVVLPASYESEPDRRYPVIYMLHGLTSNYTAWAFLGVPKVVQQNGLEVIAVMPDAGNSWYVNWGESEGDEQNAWEDYITKDLIEYVDAHYRTVASREGRAISGLSMGGYGAMTLGLRHPDLYCSIGSHSGALGFARGVALRLEAGREGGRRRDSRDIPNPMIGVPDFDSQAERTPDGTLFVDAEAARAHDPFALVLEVPVETRPHIYLDCGADDGLYDSNVEFAELLIEREIPFTYAQGPGGHTPAYWIREVEQSMIVQAMILRRELARARRAAESEDEDKDADPR